MVQYFKICKVVILELLDRLLVPLNHVDCGEMQHKASCQGRSQFKLLRLIVQNVFLLFADFVYKLPSHSTVPQGN